MRDIALHGAAPHAADAGPGLLRAWIDRAAELHPHKPYIVSADDGRSLSYRDLRRFVRGIAALLRGQGIATGERIALAADNSIEHVVCYLGVMAYGAAICTVHVEMNRPHLPRILAQLRPRLVIHDEGIELPSIYYAHDREVFARDGMWLTSGPWGGPRDGETVVAKTVRYRTVGDGSCTGAVESAVRVIAGTINWARPIPASRPAAAAGRLSAHCSRHN